jgi:hypothetical protein
MRNGLRAALSDPDALPPFGIGAAIFTGWHGSGCAIDEQFPYTSISIDLFAVGDLFVNRAIAQHRHQSLTLASVVVGIACCCRPQGHDTRNANVRWRDVFFPPLPLVLCQPAPRGLD